MRRQLVTLARGWAVRLGISLVLLGLGMLAVWAWEVSDSLT